MLVCLAAHQRTMPLEDLERLSVLGDAAASELAQAHDAIRGAVVLATCNRFEAYFDVDDHNDPSPLPAMDAAMERIADLSALSFRRVRDTGGRVTYYDPRRDRDGYRDDRRDDRYGYYRDDRRWRDRYDD